jgi:hypothetical protein
VSETILTSVLIRPAVAFAGMYRPVEGPAGENHDVAKVNIGLLQGIDAKGLFDPFRIELSVLKFSRPIAVMFKILRHRVKTKRRDFEPGTRVLAQVLMELHILCYHGRASRQLQTDGQL